MTTFDAVPMTDSTNDPAAVASRRLRLMLRANATTSFVAGAIGLFAAPWCVNELGTQHVGATRAIGAGLIAFACFVAATSRRDGRPLAEQTIGIAVGDAAWVALSFVALGLVDFTDTGRVVDVVQAIGVADFAVLQAWLARRILQA